MSLLKEVKQDRVEKVMELLQGPQNLNQVDQKTGNTVIHYTINNLNEEILKMLLNLPTKPDLNILNKEGLAPLQFAVIQNFKEGVELLLKAGADIDCTSDEGRTALHYAAEHNLPDIAKLLIAKKANVNYKCDEGTALHVATKSAADDVAFMLMAPKKADFDVQDEDGNTFLHVAIQFGSYNVFQKFFADFDNEVYKDLNLNMKELINLQNNEGNTILHEAELQKKTAIAQFLRNNAEKYGLDVNIKNKGGLTPNDCKDYHKLKAKEEEEQKKIDKIEQAEAKKQRKEEREQLEKQKRLEEEAMKRKEEAEMEALRQKALNSQKKSKYVVLLVAIGVIVGMFLLLQYAIEKKKDNVMDL